MLSLTSLSSSKSFNTLANILIDAITEYAWALKKIYSIFIKQKPAKFEP